MQYLLKRKLKLHKARTKKNKRGRAGADINVLCYSCSQWELYDFFTEGGRGGGGGENGSSWGKTPIAFFSWGERCELDTELKLEKEVEKEMEMGLRGPEFFFFPLVQRERFLYLEVVS